MQWAPDSYGTLAEFNKCHDPETGEFCHYPDPAGDVRLQPLTASDEEDIRARHGSVRGAALIRAVNATRQLHFERANVRRAISRVAPSGSPVGQHWFTAADRARLLIRRQRQQGRAASRV